MNKELPNNIPFGEFLKGDVGEWKRKWQDRNFTYSFPSIVQTFPSDNRHDQLLKEHGNTIITPAISAFMQLPWDFRNKSSIAAFNMAFTKDGKVVNLIHDNILTSSKTQATDSLMRAEIAMLILLGFNPAIQESAKHNLTSGYEDLITSRKYTFRHNIFDLLTKNSCIRTWIKTNNLDAKNGFVWEQDVTKFALSILPAINNTETRIAAHLPPELKCLEQFAQETIEPFVNHMLDFITSISTVRDRKKTASIFNDTKRFMIEVNGYNGHTVPQEKLDRLNSLVNDRQFSIIR